MLIFPYGDEPDFNRRGYQYISILSSLNLNFFDGLIETVVSPTGDGMMNASSECGNGSGLIDARQLFGAFDFHYCMQNIELAFKRVALTLIIFSPLIFLFVKSKSDYLKKIEFSNRYYLSKESIALSFIFPGFIFYSAVFSIEQVTLMLSVLFLFYLFSRRYFYSLILVVVTFSLDPGNTQVVLVLTFYLLTSMFIFKKLGLLTFMLFSLISMLIAYVGSTEILTFFAKYSEKVARIVLDYSNWDQTKYPLYFRPVMTFMSFNFMPPSMSKHPLMYIVVFMGIIYTFFKHFFTTIQYKVDIKYIVMFMALFSGISIIVFLLPGFTNGKYYIFTLPLFINSLLQYYSFKTLLYFLLTLNIIIVVDNLLFYLIW